MLGVAAGSFSNSLLVSVLPEIASDFNTKESIVAWVNVAPAIAFAVSMPIFGKLGDLYGHRKVFIIGWSAATVLAALTALAPNAYWLIALRTLAQVAGTSTTPASFGILAHVFPPEERQRAIGKSLGVLALSPVVAISVGGPVIQVAGWRILFIAQAVVGAIALIPAIPLLPSTPRKAGVRFDVPGAVSLTFAMVGLLLAINRAAAWRPTHPVVLASLATAAIGVATLVVVERRRDEPLIPLPWFGRRAISAPIATNFLVHCSFLGTVVTAPFLLKRVFGYNNLLTTWITGLRPGFFAVGAALAIRLVARTSPWRSQLISNICIVVGAVLTVIGSGAVSIALIIAGLVIGGFGLGSGRPAVVNAVTSAVSEADAGIANGLYSMAQMAGSSVGQTICIAIIGSSTSAHRFAEAAAVAAALSVAALVAGFFIQFPGGSDAGPPRKRRRNPALRSAS